MLNDPGGGGGGGGGGEVPKFPPWDMNGLFMGSPSRRDDGEGNTELHACVRKNLHRFSCPCYKILCVYVRARHFLFHFFLAISGNLAFISAVVHENAVKISSHLSYSPHCGSHVVPLEL